MFIAMINFRIKPDRIEEFRKWFAGTNIEFADHKGLVNRRLLKAEDTGNYIIMVEHESRETFIAGATHPDHVKANDQIGPWLEKEPVPQFYEVIAP